MATRNTALYEAQKRHQGFNTSNTTKIATVKGYSVAQKTMDDNVIIAETSMALLYSGSTDSDIVLAQKRAMAVFVTNITKRAAIMAKQLGDTTLQKQLQKSISFIFRAGKLEAVNRAKGLNGLLNDNLTKLTNVEVKDTAAIDAIITLYDNIKDLPIDERLEKKNYGNETLTTALEAGYQASKDQYDLFLSTFDATDHKIVEELNLAHKPIFPGSTPTPLNIIVVSDATGLPVPAAIAARTNKKGKTKSFKANDKGIIPFKTHKSAKTDYTITAPGFITDKSTITVILHATNTITIRLLPNPPKP